MKLFAIKRLTRPYRNYLKIVDHYLRPRVAHDPTCIDLFPWKKGPFRFRVGKG